MATNQKPEGTAKAVETTNGSTIVSDESNFGLIGYTVTFQATEAQVNKLAALGALHLAQRGPASRVEKILAGYTKSRTEMGANWTRKDIGYTEELARQFATHMQAEIAKDCAKDENAPLLGISIAVQTSKYAPVAREVKYAEAQKIVSNAIATKRLAKLVKNCGYKGDDHTVENTEFLAAVDEYRKQLVERALAGTLA